MTEELFCVGDDNYSDNVFYCIGVNDKKLFYRYGSNDTHIAYTSSVKHAISFEHYTDACIHIHGEIKDGNEDAKLYKVYKVNCTINECCNQPEKEN